MNERSIFMEALDFGEPRERSAYIDRACGGDERLRARVEALLRRHHANDKLVLDRIPAIDPTATEDMPRPAEEPGNSIGPYKLREQIGEGGMGVVYVAEQTQPVRRKVALKIIKPGMDTKQVIARFEAERQALAMMDHPNIAKVFDAGATNTNSKSETSNPKSEKNPKFEIRNPKRDQQNAGSGSAAAGGPVPGLGASDLEYSSDFEFGSSDLPVGSSNLNGGRPYFVMELVRGMPITDYCDRERLSIPDRLELFVQVCRAVQHAHQKGIIHRDLKPSNILVTIIDGAAVPKVIDFGVAKATGGSLTERTVYTAFQQFIGTPLYMSPEQADLSGMDVDTRSDIYSLGVLLYELLTGTTPFDQETFRQAAFDELRRIIREQEPPKPSTRLSSLGATRTTVSANRQADARQLDRAVRGELDWIVMKALEKDRRQRYETANDFASDVMRYLTDKPVEACPPSVGYRLRKFARRNRGPVAAGLAVALLLVLGTLGTSIGLVSALRAERNATQEKERATAAEAQAKEEADIAKAVTDFFTKDLLPETSPYKNPRNKKVTMEEALGHAAARIAGKFSQRPLIEAGIRLHIGIAYQRLGDLTAAQPHLERAWELARRVFGEGHPGMLGFMNQLGGLYFRQGQIAQAEPLLLKELEVNRRVNGKTHPETLLSMNNLAVLYTGQGKWAEAEPLLVEALEVGRRVLGEEDPHTLQSMCNLAGLYIDQGKLARAEPLVFKALEARRRVLGEEHPDTLKSICKLARLYQAQGDLARAEPLLVKALEARRRVLGEEHPDTRDIMNGLEHVYQAQGNMAELEPLLVRAREIDRRIHGESHPDTLTTSNNLAVLYWRNGRLDLSVPLFEEVLKRSRDNLGPDHPDTLQAMTNLGINYRDAGRLPEAIAMLTRARELDRKRHGPQADPHDGLHITRELVDAYDRAGRFTDSEPLYRETLEAERRRHGEASSQAAHAMAGLGHDLLEQQKYAEAEPLVRECLRIRERIAPDDWATFNARSLLGDSLLGQEKYAEAEPLLLTGYEEMKQREETIPPEGKINLTEATERLVQLYEAWGQPEKAAAWKARLGLTDLPTDVFARP
jgi:serine/threonine protein kinase/Tfp pilus assembly protein PilF